VRIKADWQSGARLVYVLKCILQRNLAVRFSAIPMSNASKKVSLFATKFRFPAQDQSQVERARSEV
jgi:hypothetical protein